MSASEKTQQRTFRHDFVLCVVAAFSALGGAFGGAYIEGCLQMKQQKDNYLTELCDRTAEFFNEAECMSHNLTVRHGEDAAANDRIPKEELEAFNRIVKDLNIQLAKLFIVMPDDAYRKLADCIEPDKPRKISEFKVPILNELRHTQFPESKEELKLFHYLPKLHTPTAPSN